MSSINKYLIYGIMSMLMLAALILIITIYQPHLFSDHKAMPTDITNQLKTNSDIIKLFPTDLAGVAQVKQQAVDWINQVEQLIQTPKADQTYANTFGLLDQIGYESSARMGILHILENAHPDAQVRAAAQAAFLELKDLSTLKLGLNRALYQALQNYVTDNYQPTQFTPAQNYFITNTMADFKRAGLALPEAEFTKVQALNQKLNQLTQEFQLNINSEDRTVDLELAELAGVPAHIIAQLTKTPTGKLSVPAHNHLLSSILDNCTVAATRQKVFSLFSNIAYPKNAPVLQDIINTRDELAQLLGYASYADLDLADQMAQAVPTVEKFIDELVAKAQIKAQRELQQFLAACPERASLVNSMGQILPWNGAYLKNYYRKTHLNLDLTKISEYFPVEHTLTKLLEIYAKFMDLKFERQTVNLWSSNLELLTIYHDGKLIGHTILDLYPRPNKFNHAACFPVAPAIKMSQQLIPGLNAVIANFPPATTDKPALMTYQEVKTFFHEFGHALHGLLGATEIATLSGTSVKTDFVELPSQMLENWLTDPEILKLVSCHYQTGAPLPTDQITALVSLEQFDAGTFICRQLCFARLSLAYFKAGQNKPIQKILADISTRTCPYLALDSNDHLIEGWGHIGSSGYAAKYYSYMWSNVFAKDLFAKIKAGGLLNSQVGQEYISKVLGKGGTQDPNELLTDFLGRQPNQDAFLQAMGLPYVTSAK